MLFTSHLEQRMKKYAISTHPTISDGFDYFKHVIMGKELNHSTNKVCLITTISIERSSK